MQMTEIRVEPFVMPAAAVGPCSPLPDLKTVQYVHSTVTTAPNVSAEEARYIGYGMVQSILPYQIQDGYDRRKKMTSFRSVVLENEHLKAVFLPEVGGRLWSLYQKDEQRELLHVNPVFQPCHLALRNAWFSGGVEWNVGIKGHTPYTCGSLHTQIVEHEGMQVLRMFEYERIRRVVYCIEACLPTDSKALFVKVRIHNTAGEKVPMYWWSNIAVNETPRTRVLAPADEALECHYTGTSYWLGKVGVPETKEEGDCTYPVNLKISKDFFYCVPDEQRKWVAAVEADGKGLFEASTHHLRGRKIFQWGMGTGGRHWQEFLSQKGSAYIEIQAGMARTQLEHIPMEAGETWEFMEAYGQISCVPEIAHSSDWRAVRSEAERAIDAALNGRTPESMLADETWRAISRKAGTPIMLGSGWGALENLRRSRNGQPALSEVYDFSQASLTDEQTDWLLLLTNGQFAEKPVQDAPASFMGDAAWLPLMEKADGWYACLQRGVTRYAQGDLDGAWEEFVHSVQLQPNGWGMRNLAQLSRQKNDPKAAVEWILGAQKFLPWDWRVANECGAILNEYGQSKRFMELLNHMPQDVRSHPRLVFQKCVALVKLGSYEQAETILADGFVLPDIREGEVSLAAVWMEIQEKRVADGGEAHPLPYELDFRMH